MNLPQKLMTGMNFKQAVVNKINEIITYLSTQRVVGDNRNINVQHYTNGVGIQVLNSNIKSLTEVNNDYDHPFKMSIITDSNETQKLNISEGRIAISNNTQSRTLVTYFNTLALSLSALTTDGDYYVILAIQYDQTATGDVSGNDYFPCTVYFVNGNITTNYVPGTRGFQTIIIGAVRVETVQGSLKYSVIQQRLTSDLFLEFNSINTPFSITAYSAAFFNGALKNTYQLTDFAISVNGGKVVYNTVEYNVQRDTFYPSQDTYIYLTINEYSGSPTFEESTTLLPYYDVGNHVYHYCIGFVSFNAQYYGIKINQFITNDIYADLDTKQVKVIEDDVEPGYLSAKFVFDSADSQYNIDNYSSTYIGGATATTSAVPSGYSYQIKPVWLYKNINGYSTSDEQVLYNVNGSLKWDDAPSGGSGGDTYKVKVTQSDTAGYLADKIISQNSSLTINTNTQGTLQQVNIVINPSYFYSHNGSIGIAQTQAGLDFTLSSHLVQVEAGDTPDYLANKLESTNDSILLDVTDFGTPATMNLRINPDAFISSDGTVQIDATTELEVDLTVSGLFKVKVDSSDSSPDYLGAKLEPEAPIKITSANDLLTIGLDLPAGDGILVIKGGTLTVIPIGTGVAVGDGDTINWEEPVECDAEEPPQENNNNENNEE